MKKILSFILCLVFATFGMVLLLSEIGGDFDIGVFIAVKAIGLIFCWAASLVYKWAKLD